jgi:probable phosphoglycerate mutase
MEPPEAPALAHPLPFLLLASRPTTWDPASVRVHMNLRMDGCIVPSQADPGGARLAYSHVVVLDGFVDDATRRELRAFLIDDPGSSGPAGAAAPLLPPDRWERRTADMAGAAPTWGVRGGVLEALAAGRPPAVVEVQSRLRALYPEYDVAHMPSAAIQGGPAAADCSAFLANAAAEGDTFRYHVDADPTSFPPGPWADAYGDFFNGEPGRPLLVSLLLYLDDEWGRDWAADTLFLDADTDTGVFVRPRAGRAVLMDQDVLHRVSPPSGAAGGRPRLSLVWKLALLPRREGQACCLARPEWGPPVSFGSAARVEAVKRQLAGKRRRAAAGEAPAPAPPAA